MKGLLLFIQEDFFMTIIQGILLGLLQGVAEFLPISSSGHLAVAQKLFGLEDVPLLFDVFLHLATLCAVILFFRKKIWYLLCAFGRLIAHRPAPVEIKNRDGTKTVLSEEQAQLREKNARKYILAIVLATIVTGILGLFTEKVIGDLPIKYICAGFIVTAVLLIVSALYEKHTAKKNASADENSPNDKNTIHFEKAPNWWQSLIIGFAQGVGTLPGVSRSGSTIAGSLFCGVDRAEAGEFSFIVSIPAILGAFILEAKDLGQVASSIGAEPVIAGCAAACASGYIALTWLMKIIRKGKLEWFACYLIPVGILGMIFLH
jgi:undecaprenyl-diphosphatase